MTFYEAMVNRYVLPVIEKHREEGRARGLKEGRAQGRVEGMDEGRARTQEQWMAWNRRRTEAQRRGRDFDESPPLGR